MTHILTRNAIRCIKCDVTIESKHRHDFRVCKCWINTQGKEGIFVDGGLDYIRMGGDPANIENLSEYKETGESNESEQS